MRNAILQAYLAAEAGLREKVGTGSPELWSRLTALCCSFFGVSIFLVFSIIFFGVFNPLMGSSLDFIVIPVFSGKAKRI